MALQSELCYACWVSRLLNSRSGDQQSLTNYQSVHRDHVLPAHAERMNSETRGPGLLCCVAHPNNGQLITLDVTGQISAVSIDDSTGITTAPVCRLARFKAGRLGESPAMFVHRHTVGVVGSRGTSLYLLSSGACLASPLTTRMGEQIWQSTNTSISTVGTWTPRDTIMQIQGVSVAEQAQLLATDKTIEPHHAHQAAATLCQDWGLDTHTGRHALDAVVCLANKLKAHNETKDATVLKPSREVANEIVSLVAKIRNVTQNPSILVGILSDLPPLSERVLAVELQNFLSESEGEADKPRAMELLADTDRDSLADKRTDFNQTISPLLQKYLQTSTQYSNTLNGTLAAAAPLENRPGAVDTQDTAAPAADAASVRLQIHSLLNNDIWSKNNSPARCEDSTRAALEYVILGGV